MMYEYVIRIDFDANALYKLQKLHKSKSTKVRQDPTESGSPTQIKRKESRFFFTSSQFVNIKMAGQKLLMYAVPVLECFYVHS